MKSVGCCLGAHMFVLACSSACGPHVGRLTVEKWNPLAEEAWSLEPGASESNWCRAITVLEETYIAALRPIVSPGTHHISLSRAVPNEPDCAGGMNGPGTLYVWGAGAGELRLPPGIAMRLKEGDRINLSLHVYNATMERLDGRAGVEILRAAEETIQSEAGFVLAGPEDIRLPPVQRTTISQTCQFTADQSAIAILPIMHKLGVHFKSTITTGSATAVLHEGAFRFEDQSQLAIDKLVIRAGDTITTECTYENTKYQWVTKGHGGGEMCYAALLRYPDDAAVDCATGDGGQLQ